MGYWDDPTAFQNRNKQIAEDRKKGMPILDISIKYRLSATRIFAILRRDKLSKKFVGAKENR